MRSLCLGPSFDWKKIGDAKLLYDDPVRFLPIEGSNINLTGRADLMRGSSDCWKYVPTLRVSAAVDL
jgi:hypothetical protein